MTIQTNYIISAACPGCKNDIIFQQVPKLGEFVSCSECGDMVEVVNLSPLRLDWSTDIDDEEWPDWGDDDVEFIDDDDDNVIEESYD